MEDLHFQIEVEDMSIVSDQCASWDKKYMMYSDDGKAVYSSNDVLKGTVSGFSREKEKNRMYIEREREIYFTKLTPVILEASKSNNCRVGWQSADPGKSQCCSSSPKVTCWQNSFLLKGSQSLFY